MKKLTEAEFSRAKREKLLEYRIYEENFDEAMISIDDISKQLHQPLSALSEFPLESFLNASIGIALEGTDTLATTFSAGHPLSELEAM
ncbi:MAG: hypothetical protein ABIT83_17295, partial [Massilia sp.]